MIKAKIIADSVNAETNDRLITYVLTYPRFIHSELMTHRAFSRNAASSRAIPIEKMMHEAVVNTAKPVEWGMNQKGMQARSLLDEQQARQAELVWSGAAEHACVTAGWLDSVGLHKQIANRVLEPFLHMTTIVSATQWGNFFRLRTHEDAQPEFQVLATKMLQCYVDSTPAMIEPGYWHVPFGDQMDSAIDPEERLQIAVARVARISYLTHDGNMDYDADLALFDRLRSSGHWSPFEHVAQAQPIGEGPWYANFRGWMQYRSMLEPKHQQWNLVHEEAVVLLEKAKARRPHLYE